MQLRCSRRWLLLATALPQPIQAQAIPHLLKGSDLLGIAQTGTGKTAAFALPIIQRLMDHREPYERKSTRCLVLAPTRELAAQIAESFRTYGRQTNVRVALIFGGVPKGRQITSLANGVDVTVATPGRLLDLVGEGHIRLKPHRSFGPRRSGSHAGPRFCHPD